MADELNSGVQYRRWCITINNELRSDDELQDYVLNLEHFKYCIFQRECGNETHTEHIQMFVIFTIAKRFNTIKSYFPTAHIEKACGTNTQCRDYCSKSDTRIAPPREFGQFAEERSRTDIKEFMSMVSSGATDSELCALFPSLYLKELNKIPILRESVKFEHFSKCLRDIQVTYIYGPPGSGKTKYICDNVGIGNFYDVGTYDKGCFDSYAGEDTIVFDEFTGQFNITYMNKLIDRYPLQLPARFHNKTACYTKVYIVSNMPLSDLYRYEQNNCSDLYKAFLRRITRVIKIDFTGIYELPIGCIN